MIFPMLLLLAIQPPTEGMAEVEVIAIHDGDTIKARIDLGWGVSITDTVRFLDFDAWEITKQRRTVDVTDEEVKKGKIAKEALIAMLKDRKVYCLRTGKREVYGRILTKLYYVDKNGKLIDVSQAMKESGHERS